MHNVNIRTDKKTEFIPITNKIKEIVSKNNYKNGLLTIFVPHTTAGITLNENNDPNVVRDIIYFVEELIPENTNFKHIEGNSDAHIKASLFGNSVQVIISNGQMLLGNWQGIFFCEFDGPSNRKFIVSFISK